MFPKASLLVCTAVLMSMSLPATSLAGDVILVPETPAGTLPDARLDHNTRVAAEHKLQGEMIDRLAEWPSIAMYHIRLYMESSNLEAAKTNAEREIRDKLKQGYPVAASMIMADRPLDWSKTPEDREFVSSYRTSKGIGAASVYDLLDKTQKAPFDEIRADEPFKPPLGYVVRNIMVGMQGRDGPDGEPVIRYVTQEDQSQFEFKKNQAFADQQLANAKRFAEDAAEAKKREDKARADQNEAARRKEEATRKQAEESAKKAELEAAEKRRNSESIAQKFEKQTTACSGGSETDACRKARAETAATIEAAQQGAKTGLCMKDSDLAVSSSGGLAQPLAARGGLTQLGGIVPFQRSVRISGERLMPGGASFVNLRERPRRLTAQDFLDLPPLRSKCTPCPVCAAAANEPTMAAHSAYLRMAIQR